MSNYTVKAFIRDLREGPFSSVGCYPKFWVTADGGALSFKACMENVLLIGRATRDQDDAQWCVIGCEANWEDPALYCAHTYERIESAYAEDLVRGED